MSNKSATKAKLVKTKRAAVKRPRLWAVVCLYDSDEWRISDGYTNKKDAEKDAANCYCYSECPRIIEIPPEVLT